MVEQFTPSKRFLRGSNSGFSLFEMVVSTMMATMMLGFSLSLVVQQRRQFQVDQARGILNQNLRGAMDFVTTDARQGGELLGLDRNVASFSVVDGTSSGPDTLAVQRKLLQETLQVSANITAGTSIAQVGTNSTNPLIWQSYRQNVSPGVARSPAQVVAYILDTAAAATAAAKRGEFFVYTGEDTVTNSGVTTYRISRSGTWANSYNATTSVIYILEERQYNLVADSNVSGTYILQMQMNRGVSVANPNGGGAPSPIANALTNFQVQAQFTTGAVNSLNAGGFFNTADPDWRNLQSLKLTLTSATPTIWNRLTAQEKTRYFGDLSLTSQILPRNVISTQ